MRGRKDGARPQATTARLWAARLPWGLLAPIVACAGSAPGGVGVVRSAPVALPSGGGAPRVGPARFLPVGERSEQRFRAEDPDGRARVVERGVRFVEHSDGRTERAGDPLPETGVLGVLALPPRLGEGYVFWVKGERSTDLFRARGWISPLTPLVRLPFEVAEIVAGFDRLYALGAETRAVVGVDPDTGSVLGSEPLPPSAAYGSLAFSGSWLGAVQVDLRGVLATFDAGATWHPVGLPMSSSGVSQDGDRIVLSTARGVFALGASGQLDRVEPALGAGSGASRSFAEAMDDGEEEAEGDAPSFRRPSGPLGAPALQVAALHGIPDSPTTAVVLSNGTLARVGLSDGRLLAERPFASPPGAVCQAVRLRTGVGFVCGEDRGATTVYALEAPLGLRPVVEVREPRRVLSSGNGALIVAGGCSRGTADAASYCIVPVKGSPWELRIQGDAGVERVVALADGRVAVLAPPRLGLGGTLTVLAPDAAGKSQALSLSRVPGETQPLVSTGTWLDGMTEIEPGVLGGWVVRSSSFVGVRVGLDGAVRAGTVRTDFSRTSLSGRFGLSLGEQGDAYETTDGGRVWTEVLLPDPELALALPEGERGCTEVGCGLGAWVRVGWGSPEAPPAAATPRKAALDPASIVTWSLECSPTGASSEPGLPLRAPAPPAEVGRDARSAGAAAGGPPPLESSAFRPFLGVPAPPLGDALGFDFGTEDQVVQLRAYVWGDRGAYWDRAGTWLARFADRFRVRGAVWSTAPSRPPWQDPVAAAEVFGSDPSRRTSNEWSAVLDPSGRAGLLFVKTGTVTELFSAHEGRALVPVMNAADFSLERVTGAVHALGRWFLGVTSGGNVLQVLTLDEGRLRSVASYPRVGDGSPARVVRSSDGDAVGVWVTQRGHQGQRAGGDTWLVHPVDPESGALGPPLVIPRSALSATPRPCDADEQGWVIELEIGPTKSKVDFRNVPEPPAVEHLEARVLASQRGLCADAFAARVDGDPPPSLGSRRNGAPRGQGVLLALTDRATDRRWEFRCTP